MDIHVLYSSHHNPKFTSLPGSLIAFTRPDAYEERRRDGYREPELILLLGTAHLSTKSAEDVRRLILTSKPDKVVVELCKSRAFQMYSGHPSTAADSSGRMRPSDLGLGGDSLISAYQRSLQLGGSSALILRYLLSRLPSSLADKAGQTLQSGIDFAAARSAAEDIGAEVVLGDRPIEITLRRAWDAMSIKTRWQFISELVTGTRAAAQAGEAAIAAMERLRADEDVLSSMLEMLSERFPEAMNALVHERDLYLSWSLKRSKAVNGAGVVVGVVGKGHLPGVAYALTHSPGGLRFRDVAGIGERKDARHRVLNDVVRFALETGVCALAWHLWSVGI